MKATLLLYSAVFALGPALSITKKQPLTAGEVAPIISTTDITDKSINITAYKGKKVLLSFFRYAGCPVCNMRVHELISKQDSFNQAGIEVIIIYESTRETLLQYTKDSKIPFTIIADPELRLYKLYRVENSTSKLFKTMKQKHVKENMKKGEELFNGNEYKKDGSMNRIPADFLIDKDGRIELAYYGNYIGDHLPLERILN